jgi:hypothetical protein
MPATFIFGLSGMEVVYPLLVMQWNFKGDKACTVPKTQDNYG